MATLSLCPPMLEGMRELPGVLFIRALIPFRGALSSCPNHLPGAPPPNASPWRLGCQHVNLKATRQPVHSCAPPVAGGMVTFSWSFILLIKFEEFSPVPTMDKLQVAPIKCTGRSPKFCPHFPLILLVTLLSSPVGVRCLPESQAPAGPRVGADVLAPQSHLHP